MSSGKVDMSVIFNRTQIFRKRVWCVDNIDVTNVKGFFKPKTI